MEFKDYYKILGVDRGADQKAISATFRKLARQYHPDINKARGAEDRFKEINEAYQVLGDPQKRAKYDQMYEVYQRGGMDWQTIFSRGGAWQQTPGGWTVTFGGSPADMEDLLGGLGGFSEFFRQFFGGDVAGPRRRGRGTPVGQPFATSGPGAQEGTATLELTLEDAFHGGQKTVAVQINGTTRHLDVTIPRGVRDSQRLRLAGALDGGDLYLTVRLAPHRRFERRDDDLAVDVAVSLTDALLGGAVEVPTLERPVEITIPAETQNGQVFRLRGQGMPRRGGGRGDLLARMTVVLPKKLSPRERALVEELARLRTARVKAK